MNLGIKLLVAEDDPNLGTILKAYLTQKGYTVVWAKDGEEATNLFEEEDVDACILDELLARLNATMRRSFNEDRPDKNVFKIGDFTFDYAHQTLVLGDDIQRLTAKECDLLRMFAINFGQLVDRNTCLQKIWKDDSYFAARSMDVYITKLRKYLKADPSVEIVNVHGVGFKLTRKE